MIERTEILLGLLLILVLSGVVYIGFNRRFDYAVAGWEMGIRLHLAGSVCSLTDEELRTSSSA